MTSSISELVGRAEALGAAFELKDGGTGVKVRASRPLSKELMADLKSNKAEIIEYLKRRNEPTPLPPEPAEDDQASRMEDFQRLREEAANEEIVPPSKPDSPVVIDQPGGPAAESETDAARRDAFSQARQQATESPDDNEVEEPTDVDPSEWREAFQQLSAKKEGTTSDEEAAPSQTAEAPRDTGGADADDVEFKAAFGALADRFSGTEEKPEPEHEAENPEPQRPAPSQSTPPAAKSETDARAADFAGLRQQAQAELPDAPPPSPAPSAPPPTTPPPSEGSSSGQDARLAEFESLRQQAQAETPVPPPPSPPPSPPTPSTDEDDRMAAFDSARRQASDEAPQTLGPPETRTMQPAPSDATAGPETGAVEAAPAQQPTPEIDPHDVDLEDIGGGEPARPGRTKGIFGPFRKFTGGIGAAIERSSALTAVADRGKDAIHLVLGSGPNEVTSITFEQGLIKLLVARDREVVDYKVLVAPERYFREGIVSDAPKLSTVLKAAMNQTEGEHKRVLAAVPGYQTNLRRLELPDAKDLDPAILIPQEAKRALGISTEHSHLTWYRMAGGGEMASWLVIAAANRSISSLSATTQASEVRVAAMELRAFSIARAINQPDAVCAWAASDGCDVVIVRDWVPITNQTAYWGTGSSIESTDLVNRLTQVIDSTITAHDTQNPEMTVSEDMSLYVTGTPIGKDPQVALQVAANLRYSLAELDPPMAMPPGLPLDDLVVNLGLALWDA